MNNKEYAADLRNVGIYYPDKGFPSLMVRCPVCGDGVTMRDWNIGDHQCHEEEEDNE